MKETYRQRDLLLKQLGFSNYLAYLHSPLWSAIRRKAFATHGSTCLTCSNRADAVHHLSYSRSTLLGFRIDLLAPICSDCHEKVEFTNRGRKRQVHEVQKTYKALRRKVYSTRKAQSKGSNRSRNQ